LNSSGEVILNSMRVWADISLENIVHNFREIKRTVGEDTRVMAVVKADAYGHGATAVSRALEEGRGRLFCSSFASGGNKA
jgi:alanine racemase